MKRHQPIFSKLLGTLTLTHSKLALVPLRRNLHGDSSGSAAFKRQSEQPEQESFFSRYSLPIVIGGGGLALFAAGVTVIELMSYNKEGKTHASTIWGKLSDRVSRMRGSRSGTATRRDETEVDTARSRYGEDTHELEFLNGEHSPRSSSESTETHPSQPLTAPPQAYLAAGSWPPATQPRSYL
jgi:hypothetical protein